MGAKRLIAALLLGSLVLSQAHVGFAQDDGRGDPSIRAGGRETAAGERLDLAAITITSDDVPASYGLNGESYTDGKTITSSIVGGSISQSDVDALDLRWYYQSEYQSTDGQNRVRSYVEEYGSEGGAKNGFALLEDETRFASSGVSSVDKPGLDVGEEPSEVTVSTVISTTDAPSAASIDARFRVGRLLVGIAFDTVTDTPPDEALLNELAGIIAERAQAVLDGKDVPGIDSSLSEHLLTFEGGISVQDGYVSLVDTVGSAAPDIAVQSFDGGYLRVVALDTAGNPDVPLPIVSVLFSSFSSETGALAVISDALELTLPFDELESVRINPIPGTSAVQAFTYANPFESREADSYRVMAVVGNAVLTVDVEGVESLNLAEEVALSLLDQEIGCIDSSCGPAELPADIAPAVG